MALSTHLILLLYVAFVMSVDQVYLYLVPHGDEINFWTFLNFVLPAFLEMSLAGSPLPCFFRSPSVVALADGEIARALSHSVRVHVCVLHCLAARVWNGSPISMCVC